MYRNVPVHPDDRPLLGMIWGEKVLVAGRTHQNICPVAAVLAYMAVRGKRTTIPLFVQKDGNPLSRAVLVEWLKTTLKKAGIDESICSGHSRCSKHSTAKGLQD